MNSEIKIWLTFVILVISATNIRPQSNKNEFISLGGRFAVNLPLNYAKFTTLIELNINGQEFYANSYRWQLDRDLAAISYADGSADLENQTGFLDSLRDRYIQGNGPASSLVNEKRTVIDGHPGLIFIVEKSGVRSMAWVYLVGKRFYILSLSLDNPVDVENHVKTISTFRLIRREELDQRYLKQFDDSMQERLTTKSNSKKPTTDVLDLGLKGKVRKILTTTSIAPEAKASKSQSLKAVDFLTEALGGESTSDFFTLEGELSKSITYTGGVPAQLQRYGYINGERSFSRHVRQVDTPANTKPNTTSKDKKPNETQLDIPKIYFYTVRYNYDNGRLTEMRVFREDGQEVERYIYSNDKIEHVYQPVPELFDTLTRSDLRIRGLLGESKEVSLLDSTGNISESTKIFHEAASYSTFPGKDTPPVYADTKTEEKFKYQYELDQSGNWVKRITISIKQGKGKDKEVDVPVYVTQRVITYY